MPESATSLPVMDLSGVPGPQRLSPTFDALDLLPVGHSLVIQDNSDLTTLRNQVEATYGEQFVWRQRQQGEAVFQLRFTRRSSPPLGWQRSTSKQIGLPTPKETYAAPDAIGVDLVEACRTATYSGPQWAHESEDLDVTLLTWESGKRIEAHVNFEVDVVWVVVSGAGIATVNGREHELRPGVALLIPKGTQRAVQSVSQLTYLSVHRRRRGLMPTLGGKPLQ